MNETLIQLANRYPQTFQKFDEERPFNWAISGKEQVQNQFRYAAIELGLNVPLKELKQNPIKLSLALGLVDCFASAFGASADNSVTNSLQEITNPKAPMVHGFTGNHDNTFPGTFHPIGEDGIFIPGAIRKHLRISRSAIGEKPELGDISLLEINKIGEVFIATLKVPGLPEWKFQFIPTKALPYFTDSIGFGRRVADIKYPCASDSSGVINLVPTCTEDCLQCFTTRGNGIMSDADKFQNGNVIRSIFRHITENNRSIFGATLSGGTGGSADGGFEDNFGWALEEIDHQLTEVQPTYKKKIQMKLQLEFVLPRDKTARSGIIKIIDKYVKKGYQFSVAINLESLRDDLRQLFMRGKNKSTTTIGDLIEFVRELRKIVGEDFMVDTLVDHGMNPLENEMADDDNLAVELVSILRLRKAGVRVDMIPVKADTRKDNNDPVRLEAFPPINALYLFLQKVALAKINEQFDVDPKNNHGCVGGCSLCNPAQSVKTFVRKAEENNEDISIILDPLLKLTSEKYRMMFRALFQTRVRSDRPIMLQF